MAHSKIGKFVRQGEGFIGSIITLSVQARDVRIEPSHEGEGARAYTVLIAGANVGSAAARLSSRPDIVLELELDDPTFAAPIAAELVHSGVDECFDLIWRRG